MGKEEAEGHVKQIKKGMNKHGVKMVNIDRSLKSAIILCEEINKLDEASRMQAFIACMSAMANIDIDSVFKLGALETIKNTLSFSALLHAHGLCQDDENAEKTETYIG